MNDAVTWIIPAAPVPQTEAPADSRAVATRGLRLGFLDNAKGNADHLLGMITQGVLAAFPDASVVSLRKPDPASGASAAVLERLALEADVVVSAMGD
jgi:hypothetical protein